MAWRAGSAFINGRPVQKREAGMIRRLKPDYIATRIVELPRSDQGYQHSIARVYPRRIDRLKKDKSRFRRREAIFIQNRNNGNWTIRFIMGTPEGGIKRDEIALDYDAVDELGVRFNCDVDVKVRRARGHEVFWHYYNHPEMVIRFGTKIATYGIIFSVLVAFL